MKKILAFIGTRPEAIKLAPVVGALRARGENVSACLSSQHKEMLAQALRHFPVEINENLEVMRRGQGLADTVAAVLSAACGVVERAKPDWIIVQGDTSTALAGALAGFYGGAKIAHVEAGLRSGDRGAPFPEEMNRILIGRLALLHFAPVEKNAALLRAENAEGAIHVVGNTVIDALFYMQKIIAEDAGVKKETAESLAAAGYAPGGREYILVTGHRRESFGAGLENICRALSRFAAAHPQIDIVYAAHLNPRVRETADKILGGRENIFILPPLDYAAFIWMMERCRFIMTDSGGVQEEAPSLDKPVLVMRDNTERPEVLECGAAKLTGTCAENIFAAADELLKNKKTHQKMAAAKNPYGDGNSAERIADILARA